MPPKNALSLVLNVKLEKREWVKVKHTAVVPASELLACFTWWAEWAF